MALTPQNEAHALQIQAGTLGRRAGHEFEDRITAEINAVTYPIAVESLKHGHVFVGNPAYLLMHYIAAKHGQTQIVNAVAISTGALATSEEGKKWLSINGVEVSRCKSDLVITFDFDQRKNNTFGVSTKQCNHTRPTNAQLYFTTAHGFISLLRKNSIIVTDKATLALRQFCGDEGFRPLDDPAMNSRTTDPRRFFWEEVDETGRLEWECLFSSHQDLISRLLFQKAYLNDAFAPEFVLHKTKRASYWDSTEVALYSIEELVQLSRLYQGFLTKPYTVRKGSYKDPRGVIHQAPRFGIIQMQRGGQAQHPDQLQFNLEAGYFHKI